VNKILIATVFLLLCSVRAESAYPSGFISVLDVIPDVVLDIRYAEENNFVGSKIDGYNAPQAILSVEAAVALKRVADSLRPQGYTLKIFDAYRPVSAVEHFVRWGKDLQDTKNKSLYYPNIDKNLLFREGYISSKSSHSGGGTVDLTLVHSFTGSEVDMGSPFDFFGEISKPGTKLITPQQAQNRRFLSEAMKKGGFSPVSTEWWHFRMKNEPYPDKRFDFPVDHPVKTDENTTAVLDRISGGAGRVITAVPGKTKDRAVVKVYEKSDKTGNVWTLRFTTEGFFGKNGVKEDKREGDGATPRGVYTFGGAFGVADDPGSALSYTKVTDRDVWVDDPKSKFYNQWASKDTPDADWKSAEQLIKYTRAYKHAIAINYNANPVVPGKGSAIFLHCSTGNPTAGCVSVPEAAMVFLLTFIDEETKIAISDSGEF